VLNEHGCFTFAQPAPPANRTQEITSLSAPCPCRKEGEVHETCGAVSLQEEGVPSRCPGKAIKNIGHALRDMGVKDTTKAIRNITL
jgi:hypothetical protein